MAETATVDKPVTPVADTKTASVITEVAKATPAKADVVDNKAKPAEAAKTEAKPETPAQELKTLLDEASEDEMKEGEVKSNVPEKYDFKLPEGMVLDDAKVAAVTPLFKELGLSNEQAQKLIDFQAQAVKDAETSHVNSFNQYVEDLKSDAKTFFGVKLPEVMKNVARARDQFIHKELQDKFNVSGLANDKDVLVFLDKLGRTIGEGKFIEGKQSAPAKGDGSTRVQGPTLADVYPSMSTKN